MNKSKKAVVLLSGGMDSAVAAYLALQHGYRPVALVFDYAQRHKKEIACAQVIAQRLKAQVYLQKISLSWTHSSLTDKRMNVACNRDLRTKDIPLTYVSGRNSIFLAYAFSLAESIGSHDVFLGAHTQDYSGYPDCRPEFLAAVARALNRGLKGKTIKLHTPLLSLGKKEIIKKGLRLEVPFEHTWSCYQGGKMPCLTCDSCRFRMHAFEDLDMVDPLVVHGRRRYRPHGELVYKRRTNQKL